MVKRGMFNRPVNEALELADASTAPRMLDSVPNGPEKTVLRDADRHSALTQ